MVASLGAKLDIIVVYRKHLPDFDTNSMGQDFYRFSDLWQHLVYLGCCQT